MKTLELKSETKMAEPPNWQIRIQPMHFLHICVVIAWYWWKWNGFFVWWS